jgi:HD-GYP domain-containing protein (c-di-GMP phosphodiesterase class II)/DNA-binding CsgD family transcriptional regulator
MSAAVRLADPLASLAVAADLGYGLPPGEALRTCLVATALARTAGLTEREVQDTFYTSLLMHVGCTAMAHETASFAGDEHRFQAETAKTNLADPREMLTEFLPRATRGLPAFMRARVAGRVIVHGGRFGKLYDSGSCEVARAMARRLGLGAGVQEGLYEVFEWWQGGWAPRGLAGEEIAPAARVSRVASEAAFFADVGGTRAAVAAVRQRAGTLLDPHLVAVFAANADAVLGEVDAGDTRRRILEVEPEPVVVAASEQLPRIAAAIGDLADLKSPFFHGHCAAVAGTCAAAGRRLNLGDDVLRQLKLAALLHDVGRVAISTSVWEKAGRLTSTEWEQVRMHPYHSERILATSQAFQPIATLAGLHHERIDGTGYHRSCGSSALPPGARLLAVTDAFHGMTAQRPHRDALTVEEAADELTRQARAGQLDAQCVAAVLEAAGLSSPRRRRPGPMGLSEREVEVARLVAAGLSNPQIARRLVISRRTAEHHVQHVYAKIGVSTRAGMAMFAVEHGLLSGPPHSSGRAT